MHKSDHLPRLPAEWEPQSGVIIAWPHLDSDWADTLADIERCYLGIAAAITAHETLLVACRDADHAHHVRSLCMTRGIPAERLRTAEVPYNDTWLRDTGPLCVYRESAVEILHFRFNAWGGRYDCSDDAALTERLFRHGFLHASRFRSVPLVLEGGSVETDGHGTLLTSESCLLAPTRNPDLDRKSLEEQLKHHLGFERVLWVSAGHIAGDDTDGHIDTLARFCDPVTIAYSACTNSTDPHYAPLQELERQLRELRTLAGAPYELVPLPLPAPIHDASGRRLAANYANFLIINGAVLVPAYGDERADKLACARLADVFPGREVKLVDCRALVEQNGSLHCMSMQVPEGVKL